MVSRPLQLSVVPFGYAHLTNPNAGDFTAFGSMLGRDVWDGLPLCGDRPGAGRAMSRTQHAAIVDDINTGIQARQCACDLRNPQGSCCLGNVREAIKQLDAA